LRSLCVRCVCALCGVRAWRVCVRACMCAICGVRACVARVCACVACALSVACVRAWRVCVRALRVRALWRACVARVCACVHVRDLCACVRACARFVPVRVCVDVSACLTPLAGPCVLLARYRHTGDRCLQRSLLPTATGLSRSCACVCVCVCLRCVSLQSLHQPPCVELLSARSCCLALFCVCSSLHPGCAVLHRVLCCCLVLCATALPDGYSQRQQVALLHFPRLCCCLVLCATALPHGYSQRQQVALLHFPRPSCSHHPQRPPRRLGPPGTDRALQ
jgi:hypothetical protein